ncbi:DUF3850 domain-containing protein [Bacillus paralicheniformis]|uniref:DUF3850 domain-containing protein n=1 Tax=Bacillus paralicheniformis TaxID=1648923 RepID=UPI0011BFC7EE|nr:DUF3850 domain-containing protein [Bacillus paralicheniformis]TWK84937.1 hypothetical protein CHCC20333_1261 [Bacillus paralicheniformis]
MVHSLKIKQEFFAPVIQKIKTFEIRKNDRNFCIGDQIILNEWNEDINRFTGRKIKGEITYITDYEQKENYIVFSFKLL